MLGKLLLAALVAEGSTSAYLKLGKIEHLFKASEVDTFAFIHEFVKKNGQLPKFETIEKHTGDELQAPPEPHSYYLELMERRHVEAQLKQGWTKVKEHLDPDHKDEAAALKAMTEVVMGLVMAKNQTKIADFREAYDVVIPEYVQKWKYGAEGALKFGWPYLDDMSGGFTNGDLISFVGRPQRGKALPHGTDVIMATGAPVPIEKLKIGDNVASVDGKPSQVYGVYPQGARPVWKFTFSDGRMLEADQDHLWQVGCKYWDAPRIMTTADIVRFRTKAKRYANTLHIPLCSGDFGDEKPALDPYLLGILLGDGGITTALVFTTMDEEIVQRVKEGLPKGYHLTQAGPAGKATTYRIMQSAPEGRLPRNEIIAVLRDLGLWGSKSEHKFIPEVVGRWSRADRLALLQGLMDSDGCAGKDGGATFSSSSLMLIHSFTELVRSLGGLARLQKAKKTSGLLHYRCSVSLQDKSETFFLPRKSERVGPRNAENLHIVNVEYVGEKPCTCIAVTHQSRLFIAESYVVTHNTFQMLYSAMHGWSEAGDASTPEQQAMGDQSRMFVSMEMNLQAIQQRMAAMQTHVPAGGLKKAALSTFKLNQMKKGLTLVKGFAHPFWVVDGNLAATVEDIWMLARQLKPAAIFVDGAYLVKHPKERDRYKRVAENADLIKSELAALAPTVCSWQFAKTASKKKKGEKITGDDIAYSDAIFQVSSVVLGLLEEDSVETLTQKVLELLKGRNGEVGSFRTNWDFDTMDFSQLEEVAVGDLQFA